MTELDDPLATPYLDPAYVARVVAEPDPLGWNAAITRGYHALSEAVASLLGRDHANWLTFGQWASAGGCAAIAEPTKALVMRPVPSQPATISGLARTPS